MRAPAGRVPGPPEAWGSPSSQLCTHSDGEGRPYFSSRYADRFEMLAFCEEVGGPRGHHARVHHQRLPATRSRRGGGRPHDRHERHRPAPAQLERPGPSMPAPPTASPTSSRASSDRRRGRRADRRPHHADARSDEHGLPHPLRALPHSGLGRRHGAARGRSGCAKAGPIPLSGRSSTRRHTARTPGRSAGRPVGAPTSSGTRICPPTRVARSAAWRTSPPSAAPRRSTRCSTLCWPTTCAPSCGRTPTTGREATGRMRSEIWSDPRAMVGGSDAGAHLDRMCGSNYPTAFLGDCLRGRKLVPVEKGRPHDDRCSRRPLFGLRDRGLCGARATWRIPSSSTPRPSAPSRPGSSTISPARPPGSTRARTGVVRVLVNGVETVRDGAPRGAPPGTLLRSGRDTASVDAPWPESPRSRCRRLACVR